MKKGRLPFLDQQKGEGNYNAKLLAGNILTIRKLASEGVPQKVLADEYDVHVRTIRKLVAKTTWKHLDGL
jgi:hypothetical protein